MTGNKTHNYKFRVDDDENFLIEKKFSESGLSSKSEFFRSMILEGYVITADGESLDKLLKLFGNISNNTAEETGNTAAVAEIDIIPSENTEIQCDGAWEAVKGDTSIESNVSVCCPSVKLLLD